MNEACLDIYKKEDGSAKLATSLPSHGLLTTIPTSFLYGLVCSKVNVVRLILSKPSLFAFLVN